MLQLHEFNSVITFEKYNMYNYKKSKLKFGIY